MLAEYAIGGGGNLSGFLRDLSVNPWAIGGLVVVLLLIYLFTTRG